MSIDRVGRFDHDPSLYSASHGGEVFGTVDKAGRFDLEAMEDSNRFLGEIDTVEELTKTAATNPKPIAIS